MRSRARRLARYFAERQVHFVNVYPNIPREGFFALVDEARRLGLGVAGHEAVAVSAIEASEAGQKSFEHARVFLFNCFPGAADLRRLGSSATVARRRMIDEFDPAICQLVFATFVRNGTWYVPTHLTRRMDAFADDPAFRQDARSKYIPKSQWQAWNRDADGMVSRDSSREGRKATMDFYTKDLEITGAAHRAGMKVMGG